MFFLADIGLEGSILGPLCGIRFGVILRRLLSMMFKTTATQIVSVGDSFLTRNMNVKMRGERNGLQSNNF